MKVYAPVFDRGLRRVQELDSKLLVRMKGSPRSVVYYKPKVGYYGNIWNADTIFKTEEAAWKFWYRDPISQDEHFTVEAIK